ncbi:hypothetical protein BC829DRAFT_397417, partial [Chytridium lagenaria]
MTMPTLLGACRLTMTKRLLETLPHPTSIRRCHQQAKGDTSVPSYLNSNDSTPRRSFSSSFRSLVKFPGGSSPNDTASASTSASTAKDDHPTKPSKKVVSIFDDDDDNRPAIHPRQLVHGPPDRNTGGSSQWCPPHPPGLRHIVQVPHLPEMADELAVV